LVGKKMIKNRRGRSRFTPESAKNKSRGGGFQKGVKKMKRIIGDTQSRKK